MLATSGVAHANPPLHPHSTIPGVLPPSYGTLDCTNCHVSSGGGLECGFYPCFNPFGYDYWTHSGGWAEVAALDSDGDGRTNEEEIYTDHTLPGFPEAARAIGCDMTACAFGVDRCGAGVRCDASHAWHDARSHYLFFFTCDAAYVGAPSVAASDWSTACADASECAAAPCGAGTCTETPLARWQAPGYGCTCDAGYAFDGTTCTLPSACTTSANRCVPGAECATPGAGMTLCACPAGASGDGSLDGTGCTDDDECASNPCTNAVCRDLPLPGWAAPGYACVCHAGYAMRGGACVVVDECLARTADCDGRARCADPTPAIGDFTCTCMAGYRGTGHIASGGCVEDVDAGPPGDAGLDAAVRDGGGQDATIGDAAVHDAGPDASARDASLRDAASRDASSARDAGEDAAPVAPRAAASCGCRVGAGESPRTLAVLIVLALTRLGRRTRR